MHLARNSTTGLFFLILIGMFFWAIGSVSDYILLYGLFSMTAHLMLFTGLYRAPSYGYLFLTVFLWLGLWFKFTVYAVLDIPYSEPTGWFKKSPGAWNEVLLVSTASLAGVLLAWGLMQGLGRFRHGDTARTLTDMPPACPAWFPRFRRPLWMVMFACLFGLPLVNSVCGIMQIGMVPRTVLAWPLNAAIGWCVSIGLAIGLSTLAWWEMATRKNAHAVPLLILTEAVLSTTTLMSRGVFLFHAVPTLLAFYRSRPDLVSGIRRKSMALLTLLAFFGVSYLAVDLLRANYYPDVRTTTTANQIRLTRLEVLQGAIAREEGNKRAGLPVDELLAKLYAEQARLQAPIKAARPEERIQVVPAPSMAVVSAPSGAGAVAPTTSAKDPVVVGVAPVAPIAAVANPPRAAAAPAMQPAAAEGGGLSGRLIDIGTRFLQLAVGRWIGLEGVMAVQAYQDKGLQTFVQAATEKRSQEGVTFYQIVSNSHYRWTDSNVWQFATLPGATAFLYYSGSVWLVALGMAVLAGGVMLGERAVLLLTGNPLLCALMGLSMANTVSQMGVAPRQDLPYYLMISVAIGLIGVIQSGWMSRLIGHSGSNKGHA